MQNVNQLFICLPHYKEELGKELYNSKIERLEQRLLTFHTTVSEMAKIADDRMYQEKAKHYREAGGNRFS